MVSDENLSIFLCRVSPKLIYEFKSIIIKMSMKLLP